MGLHHKFLDYKFKGECREKGESDKWIYYIGQL